MQYTQMTLEAQGIARSFGRKKVLTDVSAAFPVGLNLLTGPSGAGKSTLLRILATADKPDKGTVLWHGEPASKSPRALRSHLGYAPQAVDLPETLTGREFGMHIAALKGLERAAAGAQFAHLLERMNLLADIDRRILGYSGGMRRRLITAQALLGKPHVIALDEPTAELDAQSAAITHTLLRERAGDTIIVMTTHLAQDIAPHAAQILQVEGGGVAAVPVPPA